MSMFSIRSGSMKTAAAAAAAAAGALLATSATAEAVVYDANQDLLTFEQAASGPVPGQNGVWSYGTASDAQAFTPFPATEHNDSIVLPGIPANTLQGWQEDTTGDLVPAVAVNTSGGDVTSSCCGVYSPNEIWMHPGNTPDRRFAVIVWTAPTAGTASYNATFINEGTGASTVFVVVDGTPNFQGTSAGDSAATGTPASGSGFSLQAGDTIAFAVGPNAGGSYGGTSTGVFASVDFTPIPEPASLSLLSLGALGLLARRRRTV